MNRVELSTFVFQCTESKYIKYNTTSTIVPGKLNVHLVPHSHDDVGWLKTIDQYYLGTNNTIQGACVQAVLDSIVPALLADKNRKFIFVEQAFFQRWWNEQSEEIQSTVKKLISSGQLELINGGYCMHDEATSHYIDMIDQTTLGHRYIKEQFNVTPRIGWQIDPFGHSAVQAYLFGAEVGFDSLFFARIDYQDRAKRKNEKSLEVIWRGSKSFGSSAQIFAGAFPENYEPPSNFYFEVNDDSHDSPIVQDNINLFDYNVPQRINEFVAAAVKQANITRTNHIMWTMGTDFKYQYAHTWFKQMDKFIHYVNQDGRFNALYSTPSIYTDVKHAAKEAWPIKTDDYFPYADREHAYWTGFFTSRPALKVYVRVMSAYYLAARQLEFFKGRNKSGPNTDSLADAIAIANHHDAVTGTEKQHVAYDYALRLAIGYKEAENVVAESLAGIANLTSKTGWGFQTKFHQCPLLNISYCPPSEVDLSNGKNLVIVVYNPLGWTRNDVIRIPVINENVAVWDSSGKEVESQLLPLLDVSVGVRKYHVKAYLGISPKTTPSFWLAFSATVPPLGFSTYIISSFKSEDATSVRQDYKSESRKDGTIQVGPGKLKLIYYENQGNLAQYINSKSLVKESVQQSYLYYRGDEGDQIVNPQASGAYVFRPNGTYPIKSDNKITRVYKEKEHVEVEFLVGPIPFGDKIGKEVVTQITTTLKNNKTFYTDSSGRDFIERIRDYRKDWDLEINEPIAGNYYPINLGIYLKDNSNELSVLVDRSVGGSSLRDGQLELMLHRRLIRDDSRGVGEALNEAVCISKKCRGLTIVGKYYLRIDPLGEGARWRRSFGQEIYSPLLVAFTEQDGLDWTKLHLPTFHGMAPSYNLPENVAIITLQELEDGKVLFRLAHLYEVGEDKDLSVMTSVELKKVFPYKKIRKVTETSLSANQERTEMERKRLVWKVEGSSEEEEPKVVRGGPVDPAKLVVNLAPMEIRTFIIEFNLIVPN
ncbi:hypothetical protein ACB092_04G215900 [Castanea dentata]